MEAKRHFNQSIKGKPYLQELEDCLKTKAAIFHCILREISAPEAHHGRADDSPPRTVRFGGCSRTESISVDSTYVGLTKIDYGHCRYEGDQSYTNPKV